MAGRDHSRYQQGIIHRYYEHVDTIALQKLGEIVSDLYLAEGGAETKLWQSARTALAKLTPPDDARVKSVLAKRSITGLAKLVSDLGGTAKALGGRAPASAAPDPMERIVGQPAPQCLPPSTPSAPAATGSSPAPSAQPHTPGTSAAGPPTPEQLKLAMKAFRKRLKLTKLDDESRIGARSKAMTGGRKSSVVAIMAPREYPQGVWDELVRQGRLKSAGGAFYELAEG